MAVQSRDRQQGHRDGEQDGWCPPNLADHQTLADAPYSGRQKEP
jgi:hypothetical protein